jgi:hypothetical protein
MERDKVLSPEGMSTTNIPKSHKITITKIMDMLPGYM